MLRRNEHLRSRETKSAEERERRAQERRKEIALQKSDAPAAMQEYYAAQEAQREKTARLRALRLASLENDD